MKGPHVRVKFKQAISSGIGSFASGATDVIPEHVAKPWLDQDICEKHENQKDTDKRPSDSSVIEERSNDLLQEEGDDSTKTKSKRRK